MSEEKVRVTLQDNFYLNDELDLNDALESTAGWKGDVSKDAYFIGCILENNLVKMCDQLEFITDFLSSIDNSLKNR